LAGFQVTIIGRFWVIPEAPAVFTSAAAKRGYVVLTNNGSGAPLGNKEASGKKQVS